MTGIKAFGMHKLVRLIFETIPNSGPVDDILHSKRRIYNMGQFIMVLNKKFWYSQKREEHLR